MKKTRIIPAIIGILFTLPAFAQTVSDELQRDVHQQHRIEDGLKSGTLTTREAAKLEREEAKVNRAQAQALKDGNLSASEKSRINHMQNKVSRDIAAEKHDTEIGNSDSTSSRRMQTDVQRNVNQQRRIANGVKNDSLTNHEVAQLERGQAHVDIKEARAGRDGHISVAEQTRIQRTENHQSRRIHHEKTDHQHRG